jgi:hypothetical protein
MKTDDVSVPSGNYTTGLHDIVKVPQLHLHIVLVKKSTQHSFPSSPTERQNANDAKNMGQLPVIDIILAGETGFSKFTGPL